MPETAPASGPSKHFPVSWDELHRNSRALAWRLLELGPWQGMIAVSRGGLAPAAIVARELDIRNVLTACVVSRHRDDGLPSDAGDAQLLNQLPPLGDGSGWLVVDDLVDTGRTAELLRRLMPKAHFAAIYAKPLGRPLVDTFITEVSQDTWIYLPWDIDLQFTQPISKQAGGPRKNS